jgi:hypothetical protein
VIDFFRDRGIVGEAFWKLPIYQACIMLGALSQDHTKLSMSQENWARYPDVEKWNYQYRLRQRNLNQEIK